MRYEMTGNGRSGSALEDMGQCREDRQDPVLEGNSNVVLRATREGLVTSGESGGGLRHRGLPRFAVEAKSASQQHV